MTLPGWGRKVLLLAIIPVPPLADIAEHICQIKRRSDGNLTSISSLAWLVGVVIKGLMIIGFKCYQNNSPVVCNNYVKYEEDNRLVAILKTNNCDGQCGIQQAACLGEG